MACLRRLARGEVWDTIKELTNDIPSEATLSNFFSRFCVAMRTQYQEEMIHAPRTEEELESVLMTSTRRGYPGCIGFMDGVHCAWDMCPVGWRHLFTGKDPVPSIGWQCSVNHQRRFISVSPGNLGSVNDKTAVQYDNFVKSLRHNPMYRDAKYKVFKSDGSVIEQTGLWLSVDGGYISIPELLVGDPTILNHYMNFWTCFMESERKHVECAFGILKSRFRILKLPIRMHNFHEIDDMFFTCCILHNMCLDYDGRDDGWNLGQGVCDGGDYGPDGLRFGDFEQGPDGYFSDDENHRFYQCGKQWYDITPDIDYTHRGVVFTKMGSKRDKETFIQRRDTIAQNWYYMYRHRLIKFQKK